MTAIAFLDIHFGAGRHIWTVPPGNTVAHFKLFYVGGILYPIVLPITKLSICFLYHRIVDGERLQKTLIRVLALSLTVTAIGFTCYQANQCVPISAFWNDPSGPHCLRLQTKTHDVLWAMGAWNIFSDVCIIAIVLPVVWNLELRFKPKIALFAVVCIGVLSMISSIFRIAVLAKNQNPTDPSWTAADMDIWSCLECNTGLICAAAPCIRPFVVKVRSIFSVTYYNSTTMSITQLNDSEHGITCSSEERSASLAAAQQMKDFDYIRPPPKSKLNSRQITIQP